MAWTILSPTTVPPAWNVTDQALLKHMQYHLLEAPNGADADGATLLTPMWTIQQWIDALNNRLQQFLRDTGCIITLASQPTIAGTARYLLPPDWVFTRRLDWQVAGGLRTALPRTDAFQLDNELLDWQQNLANPTVYNDGSDLPTLTMELAKAPISNGTMFLDYVAQPITLTGAGVNISIPDEMESAIEFGAMADLLVQEVEAHDPDRAVYCQMRYDLCVEMTKLLMEGASG